MPILRKLGNSIALIIPAPVLSGAGFKLGDELVVDAKNGEIVLKKVQAEYSLEELLEGVEPSMHELNEEERLWIGSTNGAESIDNLSPAGQENKANG